MFDHKCTRTENKTLQSEFIIIITILVHHSACLTDCNKTNKPRKDKKRRTRNPRQRIIVRINEFLTRGSSIPLMAVRDFNSNHFLYLTIWLYVMDSSRRSEIIGLFPF